MLYKERKPFFFLGEGGMRWWRASGGEQWQVESRGGKMVALEEGKVEESGNKCSPRGEKMVALEEAQGWERRLWCQRRARQSRDPPNVFFFSWNGGREEGQWGRQRRVVVCGVREREDGGSRGGWERRHEQ